MVGGFRKFSGFVKVFSLGMGKPLWVLIIGTVITTFGAGNAKKVFSAPTDERDLIVSEHFDALPNPGTVGPSGRGFPQTGFEFHNSILAMSEKRGWSLRLDAGTYATVNPPHRLSAQGGTILFWFKPLWAEGEKGSHTFLSMPWADGKKSYMAISFGWWEPQGSQRLYFILSNQEFIHCSAPYKFDAEAWVMITAVWKSGSEGFCKLFVNGEKMAQLNKPFSGKYTNAGPLVLGSDKGAAAQRGRSANALLDDLVVLNRPLSNEEVWRSYKLEEKEPVVAYSRKWKWLSDGLALPWRPRRDGHGRLLESRAIFDEDMHWAYSQKAADEILSKVKRAGFNVYIPCVWHGNGTFYPTPLASMNPKLGSLMADNYDPLAYLIRKAHSLGLEVHPWITVSLRQGTQYPGFFGAGVPEGAYDVHNPEFRKFITDLMLDIVRRFDVDGINLDYIRSAGICTSVSCREDYLEKTGHNFRFDYALRGILGPARERLQKWQDDAVTEIVVNFSKSAKKIKPHLVVSVDGHPRPPGAIRPLEGRDELKWANEGWIDVIFDMDYRERIDFESVDAVAEALRRPEKIVVMFGNYDKPDDQSGIIPRTGTLVASYAAFAQRKWPDHGMAFYIYNMLTDEQVAALRNGPFVEDALPRWGG
jgi:hypothetical protein